MKQTTKLIIMKQTTKLIGMLALGAFALGQVDVVRAADKNPPERMTYQGYLVDANNSPLGNSEPVNYDVVFRIYNAKQGGAAIWAEQQTVTIDKGNFSVLLGEGSVASDAEPHDALSTAFTGADVSDRYIGITVKALGGSDVEISPRLRLVTTPLSFLATNARWADEAGKIVGTNAVGAPFNALQTVANGNVGIGTVDPKQKLQVDGNIYLGPNDYNRGIHSGDSLFLSADNSVFIVADTNDLEGKGSGDIILGMGTDIDTDASPDFAYPTQASDDFPRQPMMTLKGNSGYVGVNTRAPVSWLHLNATTDVTTANTTGSYGVLVIGSTSGGHIRFDGNEIMARDNASNGTLYLNLDGGTVKAGNVTVTSDRRLKRNIHKLDYGLADLLRLKPVSYEWRPDMFNLPGTQLGFIAQDVQEILPEVVRADNGEESRVENELSLNVNGILPVVVASVQELARENQSLKKELETLRSEMAIFKADLAVANRQSDRLDRLEELVSSIGKGNRDLSSLRN
jgi:hypothetical protein